MVNINPISKDFEETIDNASRGIQNNQTQNQSFVDSPAIEKPIVPILGQSNNTNNFLSINDVNNKENIEAKKIRNELIAINVFAALGIIASSIYLANLLLTSTNIKALSLDSFFIVCDFLLFIFILRKTDIARKIAIFFGYIILAIYLFTIIFVGIFSKLSMVTFMGFMPNILFAIVVVCFLSSERIKRHFA